MKKLLITLVLSLVLAAIGITAAVAVTGNVEIPVPSEVFTAADGREITVPGRTITQPVTLPDPPPVTQTVTVTVTVEQPPPPAVQCDKYAANNGNDSNAGTETAPYATAQKLLSSLTAGKTGCLKGGTYVQDVTFTVGGTSDTSRVTLTTAPGYPQATINGYIYQPPTSNYVTVKNLHVLGRSAAGGNLMQMFGDHARVTDCDIDGNNLNIAGGVSLGFQRRVVGAEIDNNRIHNFGAASSIYYHGIYVAFSDGADIHDNTIYDNIGGYGITFWPSGSGSHVHHNTFDGNGGSIQIAGQKDPKGGPSSNNEFDHNILSNPVRSPNYNTQIFWGSFSSDQTNAGTGNTVHDNIYWNGQLDPGSAYGAKAGVTYTANTLADPQYENRAAKDFALKAGSPAAGYGAR